MQRGAMAFLKKLVDNSDADSLATRMRRRRFDFFLSLLDHVKRPARILDVGGTQDFWESMGRGNLGDLRVTLLNLEAQPVSGSNFESVAGDARDLGRYADGSFDVVFSNSVIEHLGPSFADQQLMGGFVGFQITLGNRTSSHPDFSFSPSRQGCGPPPISISVGTRNSPIGMRRVVRWKASRS